METLQLVLVIAFSVTVLLMQLTLVVFAAGGLVWMWASVFSPLKSDISNAFRRKAKI